MSVFLTKNLTDNSNGSFIPPIKENGEEYIYCMYYNNDADIAFADTPQELLNLLIPGYSTQSDEEQDFLRIRLAQSVAALIQSEVLELFSTNPITEDEWKILTFPKSKPIPETVVWRNSTPLILVETCYKPYTEYLPPISYKQQGPKIENLCWIKPTEDEELLISLHEVGYIRVMISSAL